MGETEISESPVVPRESDNGQRVAEASMKFPEGQYEYRFSANGAETPWHRVKAAKRPEIAKISAQTLPRIERGLPDFPVEVKDQVLRALKKSTVKVTVESTQPLQAATVTDLQGKKTTPDPAGGNTFSFEIEVDREGFVPFAMTSVEGLTSGEIPPIQVIPVEDAPPTVKMTSPESDYTATPVASIPLAFEVDDDFGLASASLVIEWPNCEPETVAMTIDETKKHASASKLLELEEHDLSIGDAILVYAKAQDIDTGLRADHAPIIGDVRFIEIRPAKRLYGQPDPSMPNMSKQGRKGAQLVSLPGILEYTRALLKKTWEMSGKTTLLPDDRSRVDALRSDLDFVSQKLAHFRDAFATRLTPEQLAQIGEVLDQFGKANESFKGYEPKAAVDGLIERTERERWAKTLQQKAEEMGNLADALESSLTPAERAEMLQRLDEAKLLLDQMVPDMQASKEGPPSSQDASQNPAGQPSNANAQAPPNGPGDPSQASQPGQPGQPGTPPPVLSKNGGQGAAPPQGGADTNGVGRVGGLVKRGLQDIPPDASEQARILAQKFWSKAIEAVKQRGELNDETGSDANYSAFEKRFYEEAARYGVEQPKSPASAPKSR